MSEEWTIKPPAEPGFYWLRHEASTDKPDTISRISVIETEEDRHTNCTSMDGHFFNWPVEFIEGCQWCGPITPRPRCAKSSSTTST